MMTMIKMMQRTAADMVKIHLNNLFHFDSEILTSEKQRLESRLISIPVF